MRVRPSLKEFLKGKNKRNINLFVFSTKFFSDYLSPLSVYATLRKTFKEESFLLESVEGEEKISRYSFLGFKPLMVFKSKGRNIYIKEENNLSKFVTSTDPLEEIKKIMSKFKIWPKKNLRFFGGFVGYLGYDFVRFLEPVGENLPDDIKTPDSYFILPKFLIIFDHLKKEVEILSFLHYEKKLTLSLYKKEKKILEKIFKLVADPYNLKPLNIEKKAPLRFFSNIRKKEFLKEVEKARRYIKEGEIIQVVFSQRFKTSFKKDPLLVYRYLRLLNPSPYMYYLDFKDLKIVGASPEMLLRCERRMLVTRPIAGTRRRGKDEEEDKNLEKELLSDPKERAEHIMLVDLARNDLGRVAKKGSVTVPIFMKIERFSHVMHIVSEVQAVLDKKYDMFDALKACFPAGTVSGAPKVRAMQIINELEPCKRGIYAGCVGYFSFTDSLDTCIIIRTIIFRKKYAYIQAGAGLVFDSKKEKEYQETVNKAKAQFLALRLAEGGG
ncbi:MAG: anthranilate synthase component I [Candidatus Omnitrophica bacterium 4484_70.2]|nr:MAG: anthranilate synthase component I [Candidatus Omnitrophica bacterium 4484_70.2]